MCTPGTRGIWIDIICAMRECQCGSLTGTPDQLARVLRCSVFDLRIALNDLSTTGAAIVRECNGIVTVTNHRCERQLKSQESNKLRQQKHRAKKECNGDVTPMSRECNGDVTSYFTATSGDVTAVSRRCNGDVTNALSPFSSPLKEKEEKESTPIFSPYPLVG